MSHINDLIGVARGLRYIIKSGIDTQEEAIKIIWSNSTFKALLENFPTNISSYKLPSLDSLKATSDYAYIVMHGFGQYMNMNVPKYDNAAEKKAKVGPTFKEDINKVGKECEIPYMVPPETLSHDELQPLPIASGLAKAKDVALRKIRVSENTEPKDLPS